MGELNKRLRSMTWEDYEISRGRYKELQGFCLQYDEKKRKANNLDAYINLVANREGSGSRTKISRPTETAAIRHCMDVEQANRDCRMIEEAAMWAADAANYREAWRALLRNVTEGVGYDKLIGLYDIPFSVVDFYGMRRAFFYRLDRMLRGKADSDPEGNGEDDEEAEDA